MPGVAWSFSRLGYRKRARRFDPRDLEVSLADKVCLVTGANGGIGFAVAEALVERDADVVLLCRNPERGQQALERLRGRGGGRVWMEQLDVSDFGSIDALVERLDVDAVHALVHNAGALLHQNVPTREGIETTLACHVVGPQRLNHALADRLSRSGDARVVYVASGGMYSERLDLDDLLEPKEPFDGVRAYALAKRAQVELVRRWATEAPAVRFYAMHPGWADTPGVETALPRFYKMTRRWLRSPEEGADTIVWLTANPDLQLPSGAFVFDRAEAPRHKLPGTRNTEAERDRLWQLVEQLAAQKL